MGWRDFPLLSFLRNGEQTPVSKDTVTPANSRPLPVELTGVNGDVSINADNLNLNVQVTDEGPDYDALRIGDGTTRATVTPGGRLRVDAAISSTTGAEGTFFYQATADLVTGTDVDHDYTIPGTDFLFTSFWAAASGNIRVEVLVGPIGSQDTIGVFFKGANESLPITLASALTVPVGERITLRILNREAVDQDVYSTIIGEHA